MDRLSSVVSIRIEEFVPVGTFQVIFPIVSIIMICIALFQSQVAIEEAALKDLLILLTM
jgi:hypothetical protein